jgi:hypothetical protein
MEYTMSLLTVWEVRILELAIQCFEPALACPFRSPPVVGQRKPNPVDTARRKPTKTLAMSLVRLLA